MPTAPPRVCNRCKKPAPKGRPCPCRPAFEGSTHPGNTSQWQKLHDAKLTHNPMCEWPGCRRVADTVDHIVPLAEGGARYDWDNLQSLCNPHHDQKTTQDALRGKTRAR
jgi:5-methylcytosine-specific restriction protein A